MHGIAEGSNPCTITERMINVYNYYQPYGMPNSGAVPDALNQYKAPYQMQPMAQPMVQKNPGDMIWVQGEAGAKAYLIAPNTTVVLWDTESPTIYIKTADASGVPSMRILDFKERNAPNPTPNSTDVQFVTIEQFNELQSKFEELMAKCEASEPKAKKSKGDNENG